MKKYIAILGLWLSLAAYAAAEVPGAYPGDPFADAVTTYTIGGAGSYGENYMPDNVLGPPHGNADSKDPESSDTHLFSLGDGGSIILEFRDNTCIDGPGPDLVVFENVFAILDAEGSYFTETAIVSVSENGRDWFAFPCDFKPEEMVNSPSAYSGLAGVQPTLSSYDNTISPIDPAVSGGDLFDLADLGLDRIRFVKLQDTGMPATATEMKDTGGDPIDDAGNGGYQPNLKKFGFDVDAIAAIHSEPIMAANGDWALYE